MKTFIPKKEEIQRKWYVIDAAGKPLGRVASQAAIILNGKHKPTYTPFFDCGDSVIVINAEKAVLTGKKLTQKFYRHHSLYPGGLKEIPYKDLMVTKPELAMKVAVKRMLPKNKLASRMITRLRIFKGAEHDLAAQNPEVLEINI
jgi:large subunit ribosomal protein L13